MGTQFTLLHGKKLFIRTGEKIKFLGIKFLGILMYPKLKENFQLLCPLCVSVLLLVHEHRVNLSLIPVAVNCYSMLSG